jgi:hypothetical protein
VYVCLVDCRAQDTCLTVSIKVRFLGTYLFFKVIMCLAPKVHDNSLGAELLKGVFIRL